MVSKCHVSLSKEKKGRNPLNEILCRGNPGGWHAGLGPHPLWFGPCPPQRASTSPANSGPGLPRVERGHEALSRFDLARGFKDAMCRDSAPLGKPPGHLL